MKLTTKQLKQMIREELLEVTDPMVLDDEREERRKEAGLEDEEMDKLRDNEELDPEYFHFLAGELGSEEEEPLGYDAFEEEDESLPIEFPDDPWWDEPSEEDDDDEF